MELKYVAKYYWKGNLHILCCGNDIEKVKQHGLEIAKEFYWSCKIESSDILVSSIKYIE